ncbi:MAG: molecular chaperone HtpG [Kouleothrix sp.]|jgi:molecular chaperone HtpG|nr:molecular chaperone HtpG [Kouleothrix sp.]
MTSQATEHPATEPTPVPFRAEVKQLLHILAHSLYTDREIFLRELISNASDALYRMQFEMLTNQAVLDPEAELAIRVSGDEAAKTVTITDTGIGMTREELIENLGTIAQSGARALMERLEAGQKGEIIGQFGVGFYSAFVVADEVTVISRSFHPEAQAALWRATGGDTFTIEPAEQAQRGTTIILKLKDDAGEFAQDWKLRQVIKKHSDFVAWPVYVGDERANQQTALWRQAPRNVEAEKYPEFYRQLTMDFEQPLLHLHLSTDAPVDLHTILFVPARRERGMIERRIEGKIKLYSRKVLIQEEAKDLLPSYYRFVEGVVDSEDLPLNVSREMVQSNPAMARIKKTLSGRLTKELSELAEQNATQYAAFWKEFGVFIKEGIAAEYSARTDLLPLLRFHSTSSGDDLTSLADYKGRMVEGQSEIYYVMGNDLESVRRSPHLEALEERGIEALLLVEMMDGFMLTGLREYEGHKLRNVDDPNLTLPGEAKPSEVSVSDEQFAQLVTAFKQQLGERVTSVRASNALRHSPARLVAPDDTPNREMERIQRMLERDFKVPARIIELNRGHQLIANLARLLEAQPGDALAGVLIEQIYESALLIEGLHPNPASMVERIQKLMEAAARPAD